MQLYFYLVDNCLNLEENKIEFVQWSSVTKTRTFVWKKRCWNQVNINHSNLRKLFIIFISFLEDYVMMCRKRFLVFCEVGKICLLMHFMSKTFYGAHNQTVFGTRADSYECYINRRTYIIPILSTINHNYDK